MWFSNLSVGKCIVRTNKTPPLTYVLSLLFHWKSQWIFNYLCSPINQPLCSGQVLTQEEQGSVIHLLAHIHTACLKNNRHAKDLQLAFPLYFSHMPSSCCQLTPTLSYKHTPLPPQLLKVSLLLPNQEHPYRIPPSSQEHNSLPLVPW